LHVTDPLRSPLGRVINGLGSPFLDPRTRARYYAAAAAAERAMVGTARMGCKPLTATHQELVDAIRVLLDVPPPARTEYQLVGRFMNELRAEWTEPAAFRQQSPVPTDPGRPRRRPVSDRASWRVKPASGSASARCWGGRASRC
jgi:hypothetical protein